MILTDILKALAMEGIDTTLDYNKHSEVFCLNLNTNAKSHLYLYEDGTIEGRYEYTNKIDFKQDLGDVVVDLCEEFAEALHGRNFGQQAWFDLCKKLNVECDVWI